MIHLHLNLCSTVRATNKSEGEERGSVIYLHYYEKVLFYEHPRALSLLNVKSKDVLRMGKHHQSFLQQTLHQGLVMFGGYVLCSRLDVIQLEQSERVDIFQLERSERVDEIHL